MVDKDQILKRFRHYFYYKGDVDIDDEGVVNITGTASLVSTYSVKKLPVKFGIVSQLFKLADLGLETLEGCPHTVGHFDCSRNKLTTLEHGPTMVYGSYQCNENKLENLLGAPEQVSNLFTCNHNPLSSLEGLPQNGGTHLLRLKLPYSRTLPLLRVCFVENKQVEFFGGGLNYPRKKMLEEIFNSPETQGPGGVLRAASMLAEVSQAPHNAYEFEGNAEL